MSPDSTGKLLAKNIYTNAVFFDLYGLTQEQVLYWGNKLKKLPLNSKAILTFNNPPRKVNAQNRYVLLENNAEWKSLTQYYILSNFCPNIMIEQTTLRYYQYPIEMSHILGYTGFPSTADIASSSNSALKLPTAKTGKCGIEKQYEARLFGKTGIRKLEVNSRRKVVRTIDEIPSKPGDRLELTVNANLQQAVYKILSDHISGTCIVMDVDTGAILALVSYPGYDTNIFSKKISTDLLKSVYSDPAKPLINKAISGLYAPGSTFKIITALAGLHYGVINANTRFNCNGYCTLGKHQFYCWKWKYGGHGNLNVQEALEQSCDCFFYNLSHRINPDMIAKVANDFGLGVASGIDIPNGRTGLIPTKSWKETKKKQKWTTGDSYNMSIGQGYVLTTPLQLARMTAIFANGLRPVVPHLYKNFYSEKVKPLDYKEEHIQVILNGMYDVVNSPYGTARKSAIDDMNFDFAGKTGSSQVVRISSANRTQGKTVSDIYEEKDHALFIAFAPTDYPKYAVCVVIEHGGGGASVAAPIARDVLKATWNILEQKSSPVKTGPP